MASVAFLGLGVMGRPMAGHLVKAGHRVWGYSRRYEAVVEAAATYGFEPVRTIAEAVAEADVIFTMVGYPADVREVYEGPGGIFEKARRGALCVDLTTSEPALAVELAEKAKAHGLRMMDAPVSGGDSGAKNGKLVIMCGAEAADFAEAEPYLNSFGKATLIGPPGAGQHCKVCNQIVVAGNTVAYTEALAYMERVGLDAPTVLSVITGGAAGSWQLANMAPRALSGDFAPGFFVKHFIKDMRIAVAEAKARNLELPALNCVLALYEQMAAEGKGDWGTQALVDEYKA